jgi:hypothetical protein
MNAISINKIQMLASIVVITCVLSACVETVTDFGFTGQISGMIKDQNGNPVSADPSNPEFTVFLLGGEETLAHELRVNPDGTYANLHMYPQSYAIWVDGPVDGPLQGDLFVDLKGAAVIKDITVTPFISLPPATVSVSGGQLQVSYEINPSAGHTVSQSRVLISTVAKVGVNTGNGPRWQTRSIDISGNSGTQTIALDDNLLNMAKRSEGNGNLHIRIAARSDQTSRWNLSEPITIKAP